jgi:hypothetical protein
MSLISWAIRRYEEVCLWPPGDYLNDTPQWELDLMWLIHQAKQMAQREIEQEQADAAERAANAR